ncbi:MAG: hypothetical protein HQM00_08270, partial [Magnetococcales bacterium]|nr:hypothetical protein [Magnetococcales bacterium]
MNAHDFSNQLITLLQGISYGDDAMIEEAIDSLSDALNLQESVRSFEDAGILTRDAGLMINLRSGRIQITL